MIEQIPDEDLTFDLNSDLNCYGMDIQDNVQDICEKYFNWHMDKLTPTLQKTLSLQEQANDLQSAY